MTESESSASDAIDLLETALQQIDELPLPALEQNENRKKLWNLLPLLSAVRDQIQLVATGKDSSSSERLALEAPDLTAEHPDTEKAVAEVLLPIVTIQTDPNQPLSVRVDWDPIWKERVDQEVRDCNQQIAEKQFGFVDDHGEIHYVTEIEQLTVGYVRAVTYSFGARLKNIALPLPFNDQKIKERIKEARRKK